MPNMFEKMARSSRALVERVHGDLLRISFMANGKLDPDRSQIEVRAIVSVSEPELMQFRGGGKNAMRGEVGACHAVLYLDHATYTGPALRVGDKIRALEKPGQPVWQIAQVADRDQGLMKFPLTEA